GLQRFPHTDDVPVARTVRYFNNSSAPVSLQLAFEVTDDRGVPPPAGMFVVEPAALLIPAQSEAEAIVTADTRVPAPDGLYSGLLIASSSDETVRVPLAIDKEVESYDVDFSYLDRQGQPVFATTDVIDLGAGTLSLLPPVFGTGSTRLRRGTYH